jgi:RNA polymerase sigma-70 factor (family 1)
MDQTKLIVSDDELLLQQIGLGSKDSFNLLYEKYWEKTYADAYKRLQDEDGAKDVIQDIFTHIWLKRDTLQINNLPAYLNIAVRNKAIKFLAKQKLKHPFFEILDTMPAAHVQADSNVLWKEFLQAYEALLNLLPEKRQVIFRMRFQDDLSTKDIASELGITRKTVQNQLTKAVEQLRISLIHFFSVLLMLLYGTHL